MITVKRRFVRALYVEVGRLVSGREDTPVGPEQLARLKEKMADPPSKVGGRSVSQATVLDGLRLDFGDGEWLLMRPSGTEPVVRYYVEARSGRDLDRLTRDGREALLG